MKLASMGCAVLLVSAAAMVLAGPPLKSGRASPPMRSVGPAISYSNLTVFPVIDTRAIATGRYVTLDEGLKAGTVRVRESHNGGEVNTLYITNTGAKPVYIMGGEVVLGGQQDRCLGRDALVAPGKRDMPLTVFCVEHGRWTGKADFAASAITLADAEIRKDAQEGAFSQSIALGGMAGQSSGRAARRTEVRGASASSVGGAQEQVWSKVAAKNKQFKAESPTGTYRGVLQQSAGESSKLVAPYVKALASAVAGNAHAVGVVVAIDGKLVASDTFSDPGLFHRLWPKLLRSYASLAAQEVPTHKTGGRPLRPDEAEAFMSRAERSGARTIDRATGGVSVRIDAPGAYSYQIAPAALGGGRAAGPALHTNVLRK